MSKEPSHGEGDQVDRAILDALRQRADVSEFADDDDDDDALITAAVTAHLRGVRQARTRRNSMAVGVTVLFAAAAAVALWVLPSDAGRDAPVVAQTQPTTPTQANWVLEPQGTPLEGIIVARDHEACGLRDDARACLAPGSRAAFDPDGNVQLHEGTARIEAEGPIVLVLAGVRAQASTDAANFSATLHSRAWTVSVESGAVTVTGPDGTSQVLEAGESAGSEAPVDSRPAADPLSTNLDVRPPDAADTQPNKQPDSQPDSQPNKQPTPSADALLQLARSQRAGGEFSAAAQTYEQLIRAYPSSAKVRAMHVSLAQLYQGPLDDPGKALTHFDAYLERGGPLAEDAHYGKIRALRALGRTAAAQTELDAFLRSYPDSAHADALRGN